MIHPSGYSGRRPLLNQEFNEENDDAESHMSVEKNSQMSEQQGNQQLNNYQHQQNYPNVDAYGVPIIRTYQDLKNLPPMSPECLDNLLHNQQMVLRSDGKLMKKHIYRITRESGGKCGHCNRCCGGCCDDNKVCQKCNCHGCCDRQRYIFRRESGGTDASINSVATLLLQKQEKTCC